MIQAAGVKGLVITGFGLNCEDETAHALSLAGAVPVKAHLNDVLDSKVSLMDSHLLCFIGGFSFGDHIGAGTVLAAKFRTRLRSRLLEYVDSGRLIIGICNGFQALVRLGLLPAVRGERFARRAALLTNDSGVFRNSWVTLSVNPGSPCVFTRGIGRIDLPVRHGEGKFVVDGPETDAQMEKAGQKTLFYADPATGLPTAEFPHNPNGSPGGVAGICDPTGRIFGLMPHPEAFLYPWNHPDWTKRRALGVETATGEGLPIFANAVNFANANLL